MVRASVYAQQSWLGPCSGPAKARHDRVSKGYKTMKAQDLSRACCTRLLFLLMVAATSAFCVRNPELAKKEYVREGDRHFEERRYPEAAIEYRNAVKLDGKFAEARRKLAKAYARSNEPGNALQEYVRAADLLPDDASAQLDAARALLLTGQFEDARTRAEKVLETDPKNVDALVLRASASAGLKDFEGAISIIDEAITLDPSRAGSFIDLATLQAVQGKSKEAEAAFKQAIAVDPKSITAHLALANFQWMTGRREDAERSIREAIEIGRNDLHANLALANFLRATGRAAEAEAPLKVVVALSDNLNARLALADYYIAQQRPNEARLILEELAEKKEAVAAAKARLAAIDYQNGRRDQAYATLDEILEREPHNVQVHVVRGGWLLAEKRFDEALAQAQNAVRANAQSADAYSLLGSVYVAKGNPEEALKAFTEVLQRNPKALGAQIALAELNLALAHADAAVQFAEQAVRNQPLNGTARLVLAKALLAAGNTARAKTELAPVVEAAPKAASVHTLTGQIAARERDYAAAERSFQTAVELDGMSVDAMAGLVQSYLSRKQVAEAERRVEEQLTKVPDNPRLLVLAGRTFAIGGNLQRSEAVLKKAVEVDPSHLEAYHVLGQIYVRQNKLDDARREYERLASRRPDNVATQTMIAMILQTQAKLPEAKQVYEKILAIDPRAAVAANNLAYMHAENGTNLDVALNLAQTAKSVLPENPDVDDTLGWVMYKREMATLAIEPLERSARKNPANPMYQYHLGLAYFKTGDKIRARTAFEKALKLNPNFEGSADARKMLVAIGD